MLLGKLFQMQKGLDQHIEEKHKLENEDLFNRKVLALFVEIGELANETRCFKFWSVRPSSEKEIILEEFVDGIHFILSLGLECGFDKSVLEISEEAVSSDVNNQFLAIYEQLSVFQKSKNAEDYIVLFKAYMKLANLLGISNEEMVEAYFKKNEVNYQRQQNNY
jgi:dimeric dUTPase (all-alpha-NTP-PPase superfamily)